MIRLNLSQHCIETELKKKYNRAISAYFKAGPEEKDLLEHTIETACHALEILNFAQLRAHYPELAGGTDQTITLSVDGDTMVITTENSIIRKSMGIRS